MKKSSRVRTNSEHKKVLAGKSPDPTAAPLLAHVVWILGVVAVTWSTSIWVGITTYQPASIGLFKDLNYSATIVHGLWMLGLLLVALHFVLHGYQTHAIDDARFPGQLGTLVIPRTLRWLRIAIFIAIVIGPTGAYTFLFWPRMFGLSIVHRGGQETDADTKKGFALITDWGATYRAGTRNLFRDWSWHSWNDDRPSYKKSSNSTGIDAWPGFSPTIHAGIAVSCVASLAWLVLRPLPRHRQSISSMNT